MAILLFVTVPFFLELMEKIHQCFILSVHMEMKEFISSLRINTFNMIITHT